MHLGITSLDWLSLYGSLWFIVQRHGLTCDQLKKTELLVLTSYQTIYWDVKFNPRKNMLQSCRLIVLQKWKPIIITPLTSMQELCVIDDKKSKSRRYLIKERVTFIIYAFAVFVRAMYNDRMHSLHFSTLSSFKTIVCRKYLIRRHSVLSICLPYIQRYKYYTLPSYIIPYGLLILLPFSVHWVDNIQGS